MTVFRCESLNHSLNQLIENQSLIYSGNKEVTVYMSGPFSHLRKWFVQTLWLVLELINIDFKRGSHYLWHWMNSSGHRVTFLIIFLPLKPLFLSADIISRSYYPTSIGLYGYWILDIIHIPIFRCRSPAGIFSSGLPLVHRPMLWVFLASRQKCTSVGAVPCQMSSVSGLDTIHMVTIWNSQLWLIFQWRFCPVGINQVCAGL